jgi:hypothetical protein
MRRITIRGMMVTLLVVAVYLALLNSPIGAFVGLGTGPLIGAMIHRRMNGRGIVGGILGGVAGTWAFGVVMYARAWLFPTPNDADYLGPVFALLVLGWIGLVAGSVVGTLVWAVAESIARDRIESRAE